MEYSPSAKELSHFPFLKKAQDHVRGRFASLDSLLKDKKGEALIERALARIQDAITPKKTFAPEVTGTPEDEIAAYALARIIVSCVNDRQLDRPADPVRSGAGILFSRQGRGLEPELPAGRRGILPALRRACRRTRHTDHAGPDAARRLRGTGGAPARGPVPPRQPPAGEGFRDDQKR